MELNKSIDFKYGLYKKLVDTLEKVLTGKVYFSIKLETSKHNISTKLNTVICLYTDNKQSGEHGLKKAFSHDTYSTLELLDTELLENVPNYKSIYDNPKTTTPTKRTSRRKT